MSGCFFTSIIFDRNYFLSIIKKNIPDAKVTLNGKPISVVEEILGGEPSKIFKDFKYTSLDRGINKTINFY